MICNDCGYEYEGHFKECPMCGSEVQGLKTNLNVQKRDIELPRLDQIKNSDEKYKELRTLGYIYLTSGTLCLIGLSIYTIIVTADKYLQMNWYLFFLLFSVSISSFLIGFAIAALVDIANETRLTNELLKTMLIQK